MMDQPHDPAYRLVHRIITHYQVMTLSRLTGLTWIIAVVPSSLALYLGPDIRLSRPR